MCVQPEFANYNVKTIGFPDDHWDWCDNNNYPFRVFINSDGGGYNHHIVEFQSLEHAQAYMQRFGISAPRCLYAEDLDGRIHYLNTEQKDGGNAA